MHRRISESFALAAVISLLFLAGSGFCQVNTGRITGSVLDASGAAIPDVDVRATNENTGVITQTKTLGNGDFLLNFLVPGSYRVEVEKAGFQKEAKTSVIVNAGALLNLDFQLKLGEVRETIEVEANPVSVSTESSELSQTFSYRQLDQLPNIDRNPLYQMNLMPGANNDRGSGNYGNNGGENGSAVVNSRNQLASIGGVNANATSVFVEGTFNREPQNAYVGVVPAIEAIQEVQVYTGKYNAEFGFSGSAVVNVISKSGTNEFHGALFEYLRNRAPDSRPFFAEEKTPFQRNQFGGAFGGPIKPNKLFFFGSYQGTRFNTSGAGFTSAPTERMTQGDFSELYDLSGVDRAGNVFGQLYDPFSRKFDAEGNVISAIPFANNVIPRALWDPATAKMNDDRIFGIPNRPGIDNNLYYTLNVKRSSHQIDARYDYNLSSADRFFYRYSGLQAKLDNVSSINDFWQGGEADSDSLNQNMQVSHLRNFGPTRMNELRLGYNRTRVDTRAKSMREDYNNQYGIPNGNLGDPITRGLIEFSVTPGHTVGDPDWVAFIVGNTLSLIDNFTWVRGHHNVKVGANINHIHNTSADTMGGDSPRGTMYFSSHLTSYDGEDAGYDYPSFLLGIPTAITRARFVSGWPYQTYWQNAWYVQDDYKILPSLTLNLGFRYELSTRPVERFNRQSNWDTRTNELVLATEDNRSPSLQLPKKEVGPRFGFAWSPDRGKTSLRGGYGISYWQAYWSGPLTILGLTYPSYVKDAFVAGSDLNPVLQLSRDGIPLAQAHYDDTGKLLIPEDAVIRGTDYYWRNQRVDQTSLNIEREIRQGMVIDIGYLSVRGRYNNHGRNLNQAPPGPAGEDFNLRRPLHDKYPGLGDIPVQFSEANSYYDALTATFRGVINKYAQVYATYAHGRNFSDGNNINPNDLKQYYGPTPQDIAHIVNAQVTLDLPVGRGKTYLASLSPVLDGLIGGWQYSGFLHIRSGTRFGVSSPVSTLNNGQGNRPDRIKDGNLPVSERTLDHWYDTTAFVNHLEDMTYGNAGTNPLFADGQVQLDSSIFKTFRLRENLSLQFRTDLFNTFNHPDFNPPTARVGSRSNGVVSSTSTDPRRFQFGLRLYF